MDETKDSDAKVEETKSAPVMDVKPPKAAKDSTPAVDDDGWDEAASKSDDDKPSTADTDAPTPAAEVEVNSEGQLSDAAKTDDQSTDKPKFDVAAATAAANASDNNSNPTQPAKKKSSMLVVIVAVVVFLLLATAAYLAYKNNKKTTSSKSTTTATTSTSSSSKLTTNDIDQANQSIDQQLNSTNDSSDFGNSDLSNTTIGL